MNQGFSSSGNNGNLPSFIHPRLKEVTKDLELVEDCWDQLRTVEAQKKHLPRERGEPLDAYEMRIKRSSYPSFFRDGIDAFAGSLSRFELRNAPKNLIDAQNDIDGKGNSLKAWFMAVDSMLMRDNGCLIMVDAEKAKNVNRSDDIRNGIRPFFSYAERKNVLNWRTTKSNGREIISAVTILEWHEVIDGEYGIKIEPVYRVMNGGDWQLIRIKDSNTNQGKSAKSAERLIEIIDQGEFLGYNKSKLSYPPVVWYKHPRSGIGEGAPMMLSVAKLTLDWFRSYSDFKELLHMCAMPVPVLKDSGRPMIDLGDGQMVPAPITLGPHSIMQIYNENGSFSFAEPSASSLNIHIEAIKGIEGNIDRSLMNFVFGGGNDRTATEAKLQTASIQANLNSLSEAKESVMQSLYELWSQFTGESIAKDAGIDMLASITQEEVNNDTLSLCSTLYDKGLMLRETFTALVQRRGLLRPKVDAKKEAALLAVEEEKNNALLNPPPPSQNDLVDALPNGDQLPQ